MKAERVEVYGFSEVRYDMGEQWHVGSEVADLQRRRRGSGRQVNFDDEVDIMLVVARMMAMSRRCLGAVGFSI